MNLDTLQTLVQVAPIILFSCLGLAVAAFVTAATVGTRAESKVAEAAKASGIDWEDRAARQQFLDASSEYQRKDRLSNGVFLVIPVALVMLLVSGVTFAIAEKHYFSGYRTAVATTLDESYGVKVDHRSAKDLPKGDEVVSTALILNVDGGAKQCTVASGYSPADLTVVCGGQELLPRR